MDFFFTKHYRECPHLTIWRRKMVDTARVDLSISCGWYEEKTGFQHTYYATSEQFSA